MNIRIKGKLYHVDLENQKVKNFDGGYLRNPEKIKKILEIAEKCKASREQITADSR